MSQDRSNMELIERVAMAYTTEHAHTLFLEHCRPGDRGALERHGERAAVAAIMSIVPELYGALELATDLLEDAERESNWTCGDPYSDEGPIKDFRALLDKARGAE